MFPNAACVISIIDRLIHHSEILVLEGESYVSDQLTPPCVELPRRH